MGGFVGLGGTSGEAASPFHEGEKRVQTALGVRDQIEPWARRVVRRFLPDEHAHFYSQLPFLVAAARDRRGRPWATVLAGEPGFISVPDDRSLSISAGVSKSDALAGAIKAGADLGMLGIELHSRRRNRVNGHVRNASSDGLLIDVDQTFGNCPQHIHPRTLRVEAPREEQRNDPSIGQRSTVLSPANRRAIEFADTFFIASGHSGSNEGADGDVLGAGSEANSTYGMDVSHRGGPRGFVEVESGQVLVIPDYAGNNHFNTLGNFVVDPRAGLLFVDFERGSLLQLTGRADIEWESPDPVRYPGAQRLIRFTIEEIVEQAGVLPLRWSEPAEGAREFRLARREQESEDVVSFYFEATDDQAVADWLPGQHLPIEIELGEGAASVQRTYSLSNAPRTGETRISVKREGDGRVSRHLHDVLQPGAMIRAHSPAGSFVLSLDEVEPDRPIVLVAAGIGITPLVAMLNAIAAERPDQEVVLVHGVRDGAHHPLAAEVRGLIDRLPRGRLHVRYSQPRLEDLEERRLDSRGRVDVALLEELVAIKSAEVFMCGPAGFMATLERDLEDRGVFPGHVHSETF